MTALSRRARLAVWVGAGVLGGLAVGVTVAQLGVAGAAGPTPEPSASPGHPRPPGPMGRPGMPGFAELPGFGGRVLHGEATVRAPGGGVRDVATQYGTITAVDGATLTVRSSDDFIRDYTVDADTRIALIGADGAVSSLKEGDAVHVLAVKDGADWHAESVLDGVPPHPMFGMHGRFGSGPMHPRFELRWRGPMHPPTPSPATSG